MHDTTHHSGSGAFTRLLAAARPRGANEILDDTFQLLEAIEPVIAEHADVPHHERLQDLHDEIITHLGNPENH